MGDSIIEDFIESRLSEISALVFDNGISDVGDLNLNDQQEYQTSDAEASDFDVLDGEIVDSEKHKDEHKKKLNLGMILTQCYEFKLNAFKAILGECLVIYK